MNDKFILPNGPYFLTHSVGPMTTLGRQYLEEAYLNPWAEKGGHAWEDWLGLTSRFCAALSALLGGETDEFCPQPNLSAGLSKYLQSLPRQSAPIKVLMHGNAFPSMGFVVSALAAANCELVLIPTQLPAEDVNVWADHLTPDISHCLITHVHSNTGILSPVQEIAALARSRGVKVMVDMAQSAGIIPTDIKTWDVDAIFGSCVKWLSGGPGAGWMWVSKHHLKDLKPLDVGWFSHARPFEFNIERFEYHDSALKFWGGTPSIAPYACALGGIETILDIGVQTIRDQNLTLMQTALPGHDFTHNGGTICFDAGERAGSISEKLSAGNCHFDQRGPRLRLSLHFTNTIEDARFLRDSLSTG